MLCIPTEGPVRADNTRKRTYRTKEETESSKSVTSTVVLTLLFIAVVVRAGGTLSWDQMQPLHGICAPCTDLVYSCVWKEPALRFHQEEADCCLGTLLVLRSLCSSTTAMLQRCVHHTCLLRVCPGTSMHSPSDTVEWQHSTCSHTYNRGRVGMECCSAK
jgi:hypothetical protein